jgi:hypothetical protein
MASRRIPEHKSSHENPACYPVTQLLKGRLRKEKEEENQRKAQKQRKWVVRRRVWLQGGAAAYNLSIPETKEY